MHRAGFPSIVPGYWLRISRAYDRNTDGRDGARCFPTGPDAVMGADIPIGGPAPEITDKPDIRTSACRGSTDLRYGSP